MILIDAHNLQKVSFTMSRVPTYNKDYYSDFSKKLIRIQYPGVVENVDKMVDTLGGMSKIGNVGYVCNSGRITFPVF